MGMAPQRQDGTSAEVDERRRTSDTLQLVFRPAEGPPFGQAAEVQPFPVPADVKQAAGPVTVPVREPDQVFQFFSRRDDAGADAGQFAGGIEPVEPARGRFHPVAVAVPHTACRLLPNPDGNPLQPCSHHLGQNGVKYFIFNKICAVFHHCARRTASVVTAYFARVFSRSGPGTGSFPVT